MNSKKEKQNAKPSEPNLNDTIVFNGKVTSEDLNKPVENAKITLVTSQKLLTTFTSSDGTFSIEIPINLIDNDNVIRVSYSDVKEERERWEKETGST